MERLLTIYRDSSVRDRIHDYLGGEPPTALYLTRCDGCVPTDFRKIPIDQWESVLEKPIDLARSLEDREDIIVHLDIEYVAFDSPAEAYLDPWRTFRLQEPVVSVIEEELVRYGISPLHLLTGQGHHFVWKFSRDSALAHRFAEQALPPALQEDCDGESDRIHAGLGLAMEFLAQTIKTKTEEISEIPVNLTAVEVGQLPSAHREMISIDISEYGDRLRERVIRIPFTLYRKPWKTGLVKRLELEKEVPRLVMLPLHEIDYQVALKMRQDADDVISLARKSVVRIPEQNEGTSRLLDAYLESKLRSFHREFYSEKHESEEANGSSIEEVAYDSLPRCVAQILIYPNDLLLKPAGMQLVTRFFLTKRWHPRRIAALISSRFRNPEFGWTENYWTLYSPALRADFYTRVFAGMIATGVDHGIDCNCVSTQEKGMCPPQGCSDNLSSLRPFLTHYSQ